MLVSTRSQQKNKMAQVQLDEVKYSPRGSADFISLGKMEQQKWVPSFSVLNLIPRRIWLDRVTGRLEFKKKGDNYWLKASEDSVVDDGLAILSTNADASALKNGGMSGRASQCIDDKTYG